MIKGPVFTEKSIQQTSQHKYTLVVSPEVDKQQIAQEIERLFKVKVVKVAIINQQGKTKNIRRRGRLIKSRQPDSKKVIITLKKGQQIPGFEIKEEGQKKESKKNEKA